VTKDLTVKILGVVATPIKGGNCEFIVREALRSALEVGPVETELLHLKDFEIKPCVACDGCVRRVHRIQKEAGFDKVPVPVPAYNCGIEDDMKIVHAKLLECDGLIVGAPVYILTVPSEFKVFLDRCRTFVHDFRLRGKVAGCLTVAFYRNLGGDTALNFMTISLLGLGLTVPGWGAATVSTREGLGVPIKETRYGVAEDVLGMEMVRSVGREVARFALQLKAGRAALKEWGREIAAKPPFPTPFTVK